MIKDLVSIIVPVYNVANFLPDCLSSIENQTYKNIEVILINDGSTDNSKQLLEEFCKKHSYAKLINQENQGISCSRNNGIANASGEYIFFLDSDDCIHPQTVEIMAHEIQKGFDYVWTDYKKMSQNFKYLPLKLNSNILKYKKEEITDKDVMYSLYISKPHSCSPRVCWARLFRTDIFKQMFNYPTLFDLNIRFGEDTEFVCRYLLKCNKVLYIDKKLYYYRNNSNSITHTNDCRRFLGLLCNTRPFESLSKEKFKRTRIQSSSLSCWNAYLVLKFLRKFKYELFELENTYSIYKNNYKFLFSIYVHPKRKLLIFTRLHAHILYKKLLKKFNRRKYD